MPNFLGSQEWEAFSGTPCRTGRWSTDIKIKDDEQCNVVLGTADALPRFLFCRLLVMFGICVIFFDKKPVQTLQEVVYLTMI